MLFDNILMSSRHWQQLATFLKYIILRQTSSSKSLLIKIVTSQYNRLGTEESQTVRNQNINIDHDDAGLGKFK